MNGEWQGQTLSNYSNIDRWFKVVRERPAVQRGDLMSTLSPNQIAVYATAAGIPAGADLIDVSSGQTTRPLSLRTYSTTCG